MSKDEIIKECKNQMTKVFWDERQDNRFGIHDCRDHLTTFKDFVGQCVFCTVCGTCMYSVGEVMDIEYSPSGERVVKLGIIIDTVKRIPTNWNEVEREIDYSMFTYTIHWDNGIIESNIIPESVTLINTRGD